MKEHLTVSVDRNVTSGDSMLYPHNGNLSRTLDEYAKDGWSLLSYDWNTWSNAVFVRDVPEPEFKPWLLNGETCYVLAVGEVVTVGEEQPPKVRAYTDKAARDEAGISLLSRGNANTYLIHTHFVADHNMTAIQALQHSQRLIDGT